jgi:hypothetical protein
VVMSDGGDVLVVLRDDEQQRNGGSSGSSVQQDITSPSSHANASSSMHPGSGGSKISFVCSPLTVIPFHTDGAHSMPPTSVDMAAAVAAVLTPTARQHGLPTGEMGALARGHQGCTHDEPHSTLQEHTQRGSESVGTRGRSNTSYYSRPGKAYCLQCGELVVQEEHDEDAMSRHALHCASALPRTPNGHFINGHPNYPRSPQPSPASSSAALPFRLLLPSPLQLQLPSRIPLPSLPFLQHRYPSASSLPTPPSPIPQASFSTPRSPQCAQQ